MHEMSTCLLACPELGIIPALLGLFSEKYCIGIELIIDSKKQKTLLIQ
ncbi:MAG: hypothetical protein QM405_07460 [Euryarchaeota archaeon]|nr:hypothetical protein [Euryarchaeota archaeon]